MNIIVLIVLGLFMIGASLVAAFVICGVVDTYRSDHDVDLPELMLCGAAISVAAIFIMFFIFGLIELIALLDRFC